MLELEQRFRRDLELRIEDYQDSKGYSISTRRSRDIANFLLIIRDESQSPSDIYAALTNALKNIKTGLLGRSQLRANIMRTLDNHRYKLHLFEKTELDSDTIPLKDLHQKENHSQSKQASSSFTQQTYEHVQRTFKNSSDNPTGKVPVSEHHPTYKPTPDQKSKTQETKTTEPKKTKPNPKSPPPASKTKEKPPVDDHTRCKEDQTKLKEEINRLEEEVQRLTEELNESRMDVVMLESDKTTLMMKNKKLHDEIKRLLEHIKQMRDGLFSSTDEEYQRYQHMESKFL